MKKNESRSRLLPGRFLFTVSLIFLLLGCIAFFFEIVFLVWALAGIGFLVFILIDSLLLFLLGDRLQAERELPSSFAGNFVAMAQGKPVKVKILIRRDGRPLLPSSIQLYDLHPASMSTAAFPVKLERKKIKTLSQTNTLVFEYTLLPNERESWFFSGIEFLLGSPMRFWKLRVTHDLISQGRTYPDFKQLARGTELKGKLEKGEIPRIRKRGQGLEFESLRDYQKGDSIRLIDWRATSRTRSMDGKLKFIVRNYQEEQDQQILFIIDSGYRLPDLQFDSALEAMLMLSYIALKYGDSVAAASFGAHDLWIPPRKGIKAYTGLMNSLYDLHSSPVPSSPFLALENALSRLHRRTFIVLISNFREEDNQTLSWILPRIKKSHLLLLVSFRESQAEKLAAAGKTRPNTADSKARQSDEEILETAAANTYLLNRKRMYQKWEHSGLLVMETSPKHISPALINRYLSLKRSGKL